MFTVRADIKKNRLYINMVGFFDDKEMKACTDKVIEGARKLKPGYDVINDISEFKPVGQDTLKDVERGQAYFKKSGIRHGVRVEGKNKLTHLQFNRVGKNVDYAADAFETLEDAEKFLDSEGPGN